MHDLVIYLIGINVLTFIIYGINKTKFIIVAPYLFLFIRR